jgi:hypothetical protein
LKTSIVCTKYYSVDQIFWIQIIRLYEPSREREWHFSSRARLSRFCWKDLPGEEREAKLQAKATSDLLTARAGIPDDAARSYLYAICNPYLTGQTIVVDGDGSLT